MNRLRVAAEGTTHADLDHVWELVADANSYARWGPWQEGGYRPPVAGPSRPGMIQWFRYGRRTSVEKILEVEPPRRVVYTVIDGLPVKDYRAEVLLTPTAAGTSVRWAASWRPTLLGRLARRPLQRIYVEVMEALLAAAGRPHVADEAR